MNPHESARRTPVVGSRDTGPAAGSDGDSLAQPSHIAHAYTRRQLMGLDPAVRASQPPVETTARLPEPEAMGAIIGFQRSYDGGRTVYGYAAIKTPKGWHCTGGESDPQSWADLVAWIDAWQSKGDEAATIWLAADWVEVK